MYEVVTAKIVWQCLSYSPLGTYIHMNIIIVRIICTLYVCVLMTLHYIICTLYVCVLMTLHYIICTLYVCVLMTS